MGPAEALALGADVLVIGRPITRAAAPAQAAAAAIGRAAAARPREMAPKVKICGLTEPARVEQAAPPGCRLSRLRLLSAVARAMSIRRRRASSSAACPPGVETVGPRRRCQRRRARCAAAGGAARRAAAARLRDARAGGRDRRCASGCRVIKALRIETPRTSQRCRPTPRPPTCSCSTPSRRADAAWPGGHGAAIRLAAAAGLSTGVARGRWPAACMPAIWPRPWR